MPNLRRFAAMRRHAAAAFFTIVAPLAVDVALAQDASTYYTVQHPSEFKINWGEFYRKADAMTAAVRNELPHKLDLAYGKDPKQRLDLYFPAKAPHDAPVFLFLHGGGFREGDRAQYGFVAKPYADAGIITAVASYRLTGSGAKYPDQPHDTQAAIAWLYHNIAKYGGDPKVLFVGGHSAGAILSADVGVDRAWMHGAGIPPCALRGIVPVSGMYDLRAHGRPGEMDVYALENMQEKASPLLHIKDPAPAAVVAVGAQEGPMVDGSRLFTERLTGAGVHAQFLSLPDADHRESVRQLGDAHSVLAQAVLQMIAAAPKDAKCAP